MKKTLILLLVTLVQSQSDGVLLTNQNINDGFQDSQVEEWDGSENSYPVEAIKDFEADPQPNRKRSMTSDAFTRRSALDKNFMRFGRGGDVSQKRCGRVHLDGKLSFYRFGRGPKDSFIRFGRARENFMRFGRGGGKDGFIRFGRSRPEDFFRAGKSLRENFIRFGKADKNFMRFGRENTDEDYQDFFSSEEPLQRLEKSWKTQDNFMRFGKNGKNGTNFLRFGKSYPETEADDRKEDSDAAKGEAKRKRREAREKPPGKTFNKTQSKRGAGFFGVPSNDFPRRFSSAIDSPWQSVENLKNSRLTPFFPNYSGFPKSFSYYGAETKRNQVEPFKGKMKSGESKEHLLGSGCDLRGPSHEMEPRPETLLTPTEKTFLLHAERGDVATVKRLLEQFRDRPEELNINCVDSLRRSALISAIENENIELLRLLLEWNIKVKDALLHAIKEEYVEAVEVLLEWEERIHVEGQPYSWEAIDPASATFTPDITPLILAAHMNNYEIIKILLDRGATLPKPHNVRCGCDECIASSEADSLRHSQARINAYKALTASSLIALSSEDPLLTAFELSWELRNLSYCEAEFRAEYNEMRQATQDFATALLNHVRTSSELEVMLNFNQTGEVWEPGERQTLERLKLAIKYKQKKFVAHPNVQQLLASIWYDGLPGFRRKSMVRQIVEVVRLACLFPFYSCIYMMAPNSKMGLFMKKPFVKFIFHSSSYTFFLMLLGLASQRAEHLLIEWFGNDWLREILDEWRRKERGSLPGVVEVALFVYIASLIYCELRALWTDGLREYVADLWNIVDFITNCFYLIWISLRFSAIYIVKRESWLGRDPYIPREEWDPFDPILLSEGAFAAGMIFSFLKLVHIFSVNPHLGPLQISLGRMIIDILKFFFIYTLVLFAFGCGMNQLMWYYAKLEKSKCYGTFGLDVPDFDNNEKACTVWRRFANLFETSQSLFWASFGLVDLTSFDLAGIKSFTRFWGLLLFGCYSVVNIIVLLNMLIAMMSNSYQIISERSDVEWKFARSHLWMSYFDEGDTLPPPFNLMPTAKTLLRGFGIGAKPGGGSLKVKSRMKAQERHKSVMNNLIARYVTAEQRKRDDYGITEDDVIEIRHDISTLRYELIHILRTNGMKTPETRGQDGNLVSKKGKVMERRLIKDFQIGVVEGILQEALSQDKEAGDVFTKLARVFRRKVSRSSKKKDWNALVRKSSGAKDPIGSTEERQERLMKQSIRRYILNQTANVESLDPEKLLEYNPKLSSVTPAARVAYAKFNIKKIRHEYNEEEKVMAKEKATADQEGVGEAKGESASVVITVESEESAGKSIVRPRPKPSQMRAASSLLLPPGAETPSPPAEPPERPSVPAREIPQEPPQNFRCPTSSEKDPPEGEQSSEPVPPEESQSEGEQSKISRKKEIKSVSPRKPGGKSKVTGEILSGWL